MILNLVSNLNYLLNNDFKNEILSKSINIDRDILSKLYPNISSIVSIIPANVGYDTQTNFQNFQKINITKDDNLYTIKLKEEIDETVILTIDILIKNKKFQNCKIICPTSFFSQKLQENQFYYPEVVFWPNRT